LQISRYLDPALICLQMVTAFAEPDDDTQIELTKKIQLERKSVILSECVDILELSGKIVNRSKLLTEFGNREKKATTAIGRGIAIPHIRSLQARELVIGFCRSPEGYDFDALDGQPVHVFVPMAAPPYDDSLYLKVFRVLAEMFTYGSFYERIMEAEVPYDVIRAIKEME